MDSDPGRRVFRAPSATVVLIASAAVALFLLGDAFVRGGPVTGLLLAPWVLLAMWGVYVFSFVSSVQTTPDGIRVQNLLRIVDVPWGRISDIIMRWQLRIELTDGGVIRCFGGPVAGRPGRPTRRLEPQAGRGAPPAIRDLELIREQWQDAAESRAPAGDVRRSWDVWALVALGALIVWAVAAVLITGRPA